jgi:SAM-dependent methyltransferase
LSEHASLVYRTPLIYEVVMAALYGRHYAGRTRALAALVPPGSSVLELCCGPGFLYQRHLRRIGVDYQGIDVNPRFVARIQRLGGRAQVLDLHADAPLPSAEIVLMQASLYQFLPDAGPVVRRMFEAAQARVILAEPIRNLATSSVPVLSRLARRHTDPGLGARPERFDEQALDAFVATLPVPPSRTFLIPGGREKVYVFDLDGKISK